ncbi:beta strand repeat-containing protein [Tunturiibacter psychrotolerans]|uniref:beta strand repeat-containing protein n=1 Tax=Tunturiibacter psychrotolerans TaxID=3069686 RepID=UPI003D1B01C2
MYRNYDGSGGQYGDTWVAATSSDQSQLSVYAAQRTSDSVVTILILNKTSAAISTTLALSGTTLPTNASVYSYSSANLQQIISGTKAAIDNGAISYSFPGYSATLFTFTPVAAPPAATTTALTASSTTLTTGQTVTLTAAVSGAGSPTGIVSFKDGGSTIGSATLSAGKAAFSTAALGAGSHTITAVYAGDSGDPSSTSSTIVVTVTQPAPIGTSITLSASTSRITVGQNVALSAIVSGSGSPTGAVLFKDGTSTFGSSILSGGKASFSTSALGIGSHTITAVYTGDPGDASSTSSPLIVTVTQPTPFGTSTALSATPSQITVGQNVVLTAIISGSGSPTGTVIFNDGGTNLASVLITNGSATFVDSNLAAGTHSVQASYSGNANNADSTSQVATIVVVQHPVTPPVIPPPPGLTSTTTVLNASSSQLTSSQSLTLTATVSTLASFSSGTVTFNDATDTLGAVTLIHGVASITTTLSAGIQTIIATYSGDSSNAASISSPLTITVSAPAPPSAAPQDFLLQLSQTTMTLTPGASGQIGFSIASQNGFNQQLKLSCSGLPSGATCTFSPATLTPSAGATGSMTISMSSSSTSAAMLFLPLSGVLLFFDQRMRRFRLAVAVAAFTILVAGCGAGVRQTIGNGASAGPAPGNYTVQVTAATSTELSHTQPMTLAVQ